MPDLQQTAQPSIPHLAEFLSTVPPPLTITLVQLSRPIARIRRIAEITSWQSSWEEGWLALAAWWTICCLADLSLRYALPLVVISLLALAKWKSRPSNLPPPPITEANLQKTLSDLDKIQALTPTFHNIALPPMTTLFRVSATLYVPYLLLTYFVRLQTLIALAGTIVLTWRASWARLIRHGLWRSSWIRWSIYGLWSFLSGEPLPSPVRRGPEQFTATFGRNKLGSQPPVQQPAAASLRFLFTIHENQRWWMGLDWTAALLPQERPAWSSASFEHPVPPPSAFTLPPATVVYLEKDRGRVRRTATWKWEEEEWRVLVKKEGSGTSRVERPLPTLNEDVPTGKRLLKAAGMMKEQNGNSEGHDDETVPQDDSDDDSDEPWTDSDGWVYGDNKWESRSGKAGMGKYTRCRRWTRIAVLSETVEVVGPGDVGVQREELVNQPAPPARDRRVSIDSPTEGERAGLKQRLKLAVGGSSTTL